MKILLRSDVVPDGKLFAVINGQRVLLSDCTLTFESYEERTALPILGRQKAVKKTKSQLAVCDNHRYTREVDSDFLKQVSRFEIVYDKQREDGIFERLVLDAITLSEIDENDRWVFESCG